MEFSVGQSGKAWSHQPANHECYRLWATNQKWQEVHCISGCVLYVNDMQVRWCILFWFAIIVFIARSIKGPFKDLFHFVPGGAGAAMEITIGHHAERHTQQCSTYIYHEQTYSVTVTAVSYLKPAGNSVLQKGKMSTWCCFTKVNNFDDKFKY